MKQLLKSLSPKHMFRATAKTKNNHHHNINNNNNLKLSTELTTKSEPNSFSSHSYSSESSSSNSSTHAAPPARSHSEDISYLRGPHPRWTEEAFKMIDLDGDGKITRLELHSLFKRVRTNAPSLSEDELAAMISDFDLDGDGCISLHELQAVGSALDPSAADDDDLRDAFGFFDSNRDGKISAEELHAGFAALGDKCTLADCRRMIDGVDTDNDGFVCFDDFCRMMRISSSR